MGDHLQDHALVARVRLIHAVYDVVVAAVDSCTSQTTNNAQTIHSSGMTTSVIRKAKVAASLVLSMDSPESSVLDIALWFGHYSARPAAADTPVSMVFAVFGWLLERGAR